MAILEERLKLNEISTFTKIHEIEKIRWGQTKLKEDHKGQK